MFWKSTEPKISIHPAPGFDNFVHGLHGATPVTVQGTIHLTVTHPIRHPRVIVSFRGRTQTNWSGDTDGRISGWWTDPLNRFNFYRSTHHERRKLIDETQIVLRDDHEEYGDPLPTYDEARVLTDLPSVTEDGFLPVGTYQLPFKFRVPRILPPSFAFRDGYINYYVVATVDYKEGFFGRLSRRKKLIKQAITLDRYNLDHILLPQTPVPTPDSPSHLSRPRSGSFFDIRQPSTSSLRFTRSSAIPTITQTHTDSDPEEPTTPISPRSSVTTYTPDSHYLTVAQRPSSQLTFSPLPLTRSATSVSDIEPYDQQRVDAIVISNIHNNHTPGRLKYRVSIPSRSFGPDDPVIVHIHIASVPRESSIKHVTVSIKADVEVKAHGYVKRTRTTIADHKDVPKNAGDYWRKTIRFTFRDPDAAIKAKKSGSSSSGEPPIGRLSFVSPLISVRHSLKVRFALDGRGPRSVAMEVPIVLHVANAAKRQYLRREAEEGRTIGPGGGGGGFGAGATLTSMSALMTGRNDLVEMFTDRRGFAEQGGRFDVGLPISRALTW
ncbi:hypothetical protein HK104_005294 [Borealophlyctis nickersoniae]|nr:hypothetical protein HK104_005294 [Borealophlyctis nickersoniae]